MLFLALLSTSLAYDENSLIIQWKPTQCKLVNCNSGYLSTDFNIYGFWPENWDGTTPAFCSDVPFNISSQTQDLLLQYWSVPNGENSIFWQHEWSRHGTCVQPTVTCDNYFNNSVNLYVARKVLKTLAVFNIVPSYTTAYTVSQFTGAFARTSIVTCSRVSSSYYLNSVKFCYDLNYNWINCKGTQGNCGNGFLMVPAN